MKPILQAVLILGLAMPVFSTVPSIDFDGKGNKSTKLDSLIEETKQDKSLSSPASPANTDNTPTKKLFEVKENGREELVQPVSITDGKATWEFMPNAYRYWEFSCTGQNPNPWKVCWSYTFRPAIAGHNHTSTDPYSYSYLNPSTGKPLPIEICKSGLAPNTSFEIYFKAPVFSTLVLDQAKFSGSCSGVHTDEEQVTVTAQNLIQLTELQPEPYFDFKAPDADQQKHPAYHYATPDTNAKFKQIAWEYSQQFNTSPQNKKLIVNDMGLIWGGRYNYDSPWNCWNDGQHHAFHRYGRQMDIHTLSMSDEQRNCLVEIACKYQVRPMFEGKALDDQLRQSYSKLSPIELDEYERVIHYHLNFARPTDMVVSPPDDDRPSPCPDPVMAWKSACPKPLGLVPFQ